jgi:hypothetical protein
MDTVAVAGISITIVAVLTWLVGKIAEYKHTNRL